MSGRIARHEDGSFSLRLGAQERTIVRALCEQLLEALRPLASQGAHIPEGLTRLVPPMHRDGAAPPEGLDEDLARRELVAHHLAELEAVARTSEDERLDEEHLTRWLIALNALRLALGSALKVNESDDERAGEESDEWICYHYLTGLQAEVIETLAELVDDGGSVEVDLPDDPWGEPLGGLRWDGTPVPGTP